MDSTLALALVAFLSSAVADANDVTTVYRIHTVPSYSSSQDIITSCSVRNGDCQAVCSSSLGPLSCSCPAGYALNDDGRTCVGRGNTHHVLENTSGTFNSSNFPSNYNNKDSLSWLIVGPEGTKVTLRITFMETESCCDHVTVYDGGDNRRTQLGRFSGFSIPGPVEASSNRMFVTFTADGSSSLKGFQAIYESGSTTVSEELHLRSSSSGILVQDSNGTYLEPDVSIPELACIPTSPTCPWTRVGTWVSKRQFMDDVLPKLRITYGDSSPEKNLCETASDDFTCACPVGYQLERITRTCTGLTSNNRVLRGRSGHLMSANYPDTYPNRDHSTWLILAPYGARIHLNFSTFNTERNTDVLEVYDGLSSSAPLIGKYSGTTIPSLTSSTGSKMYITFRSDGSVSRSGFLANYTTTDNMDITCRTNDRSCQGTCESWDHGSRCSCPDGFQLSPDGESCVGIHDHNMVVLDTAGTLLISNSSAAWLLVAPEYHRYKLSFMQALSNESFSVDVYDGPSAHSPVLGSFSGGQLPTKITSKRNKLYIRFRSDSLIPGGGVLANFSTDKVKEPVVALSGSEGRLDSPPFHSPYPELCVSIVSKVTKGLWVSVNPQRRQELNMTGTLVTKVGKWRVEKFTATLLDEDIVHPLTVSAHISGHESAVFSIMACNPYDDGAVYTIQRSLNTSVIKNIIFNTVYDEPQTPQDCFNGGMRTEGSDMCVCPHGFSGTDCKEACGPNSYGEDCAGVCSVFEKGCKNMIFCKTGLPCLCAPGFKDTLCNTACLEGSYGASCRHRCGLCQSGTCDVYTGECPSRCQAGYVPPLCQEKYKRLATSSSMKSVDFKTSVISANLSATIGVGTTKFFVVQYKELGHEKWQQLLPQPAVRNVEESTITGLKADTRYIARVILIDEDGSQYESDDVPAVKWETRCTVPTSNDYHISSSQATPSGFEISWSYDVLDSTWCSLTGYKITFPDRGDRFWTFVNATATKFRFDNLLPGRQYSVRIQAVTKHGKAPYSDIVSCRTDGQAPGQVRKLNAVPEGRGELRVTWQKPRFPGGTVGSYQLEYKCLRIVNCDRDCKTSAGRVEVTEHSALLTHLIPHAQYLIKVSGKSTILGPHRAIFVTTKDAEPTVMASVSDPLASEVTRNHFIAHWNAPSDCSGLNGHLQGYRYELVKGSGETTHSGMTQDTHVNFTGLAWNTQYRVAVRLITSGAARKGVENEALTFFVKTTALAASESMMNLTVYTRGRRMIGIRWSAPTVSHGKLKSFTVSYRPDDAEPSTEVSQVVGLDHCAAWPELYCHTINSLIPDTQYILVVSAQSTDPDTGSAAATVRAITREEGPEAPSYLQILNSTQHSLVVEWGQPDMINGVLRSFLLNVEETDSSDCCEHFPINELPVRSEQLRYRHKVVGLKPASTFTISVSAKTVTMGPPAQVTAYTRPNAPLLVEGPELLHRKSNADPVLVTLPQAQHHPGLRSTYVLLLLHSNNKAEPLIPGRDWAEQLTAIVGRNFYIVEQFTEEELAEEKTVTLKPGLAKGKYQLALALILDYNGAKSVGVVHGSNFEFER